MTIGANLNGGSLTLGGTSINIGNVNSVTNFSSGTINASNLKLYSTNDGTNRSVWMDTVASSLDPQLVLGYSNARLLYLGGPNAKLVEIFGHAGKVSIADGGLVAGARVSIATGTNATNTEMTLGSTTLSYNNIRGNIIHIADTGLSATGKVHIASGVNGGNATGSEIKIGDGASLTKMYGITQIEGSYTNFPLRVYSPSNNGAIFSPISGQNSRGNITLWASFPSLPSDLAPRRVCDIYGGFNGNSWGSEYMAIGVGNNNNSNDGLNPTVEQLRIYANTITINRPITPNYSYPVGGGIGQILEGTLAAGFISEGQIVSRISVSSSGVWQFSWNIQFVLAGNATYLRPDFHIYGVTSFNIQVAPMVQQPNYWLMSGSYTSVVDSGPNGHGTIYMNYTFIGWNPYSLYGNFRAVRIA